MHVSNLIEAVPSRLVRFLDQAHVEVLKEELRQEGTSFCVVVGVYFTLDGHSYQELEKPLNLKVEVIGGNHTRAALQDLLKEGELARETISVKLFRDLSNTKCLEITKAWKRAGPRHSWRNANLRGKSCQVQARGEQLRKNWPRYWVVK